MIFEKGKKWKYLIVLVNSTEELKIFSIKVTKSYNNHKTKNKYKIKKYFWSENLIIKIKHFIKYYLPK